MPRENKPSHPEDNPETLLQLILESGEHDEAFADYVNDEVGELHLLKVPVFDQVTGKRVRWKEGSWNEIKELMVVNSGSQLWITFIKVYNFYRHAWLTAAEKYIEDHPELIPDHEEIAEGRAVDHEIERQKYLGDVA